MLLLLGGLGEKMRRMTSRFSKCVSLLPCSKRVNRFFNYALIAGFGLLVLFVGPSFALIYFEGWTGVDAVYYCFVSLSTIGFGDLALGDPTSAAHQNNSAGHHIYRVMSLVWVLFGLAYVGIVITSLGHLFIRGSCGANNVETMRLKAELKRLKQEIKAQRLYARRSGLNMTWSSQQMMEGDLTWDSEIIPDNPTPQ
ncbi:potassium channel subfamily K member 4-like [Aplysia californica]|uniref:Potassium channel subfamily K member 4-like n=1 Tax=Aplysia californica TaxID=6500 RepID=A0ABM1VQG6_APLCA|nr:potassium channel subfamily K member 4-like [Aplysia californica]